MASDRRNAARVSDTRDGEVRPRDDVDREPREPREPAALLAEGVAAHLAGEPERAVRLLQAAHQAFVDEGATAEALSAAYRIAMVHGTTGDRSQFSGWVARAERLLAELADGAPAARGYVAVLQMHRAIAAGSFESVRELAQEAAAIGRQHGRHDFLALGLTAQGRHSVTSGDVALGLSLLDEAMSVVLAGQVDGLAAGLVWCAAIEGCQQIGAIDRLCEWTAGLDAWCADEPGLAMFAGRCSLHRGQVLALHGEWSAAIASLSASGHRAEERGQLPAAGEAQRELGDLLQLQGDDAGAAAAYQRATELGCDPQPGLALLWLGHGRRDAAAAAIRRCLAESPAPALRCALIGPAIDVLLAVGEIDEAAELAAELDELAELAGCPPVTAAAAYANAGVELARFDPAGALPYARRAVREWSGIRCPFESARARVLLARALLGAGDAASADRELAAARTAFASIGAIPSAVDADALLHRRDHADGLTEREIEVLRLVARGRSNRQIATELVISERTVARHLSNLFVKVGAASRTQAAAYAFDHSLT